MRKEHLENDQSSFTKQNTIGSSIHSYSNYGGTRHCSRDLGQTGNQNKELPLFINFTPTVTK